MSAYNKAPWLMKKGEMAAYIPVTNLNRKDAVIMGRTFYCIEVVGPFITYQGYFTIRPRLTNGRMQVSGHPHMRSYSVWMQEDESPADYKEAFDSLISRLIEEKKLYINLKDKITKYKRL